MSETRRRGPAPTTLRRGLLLAGCIALGGLVATLGVALGGSQAWWLAVPGAVLAGWWWVADPSECSPSDPPGG